MEATGAAPPVAPAEVPAFAESVLETDEDDVALGFAVWVVPSLTKTPRPSLQQVEPSKPVPAGPQQ